MAGKIRFEGEDEHEQTEALASRMIEDVGIQHAIVGMRVERVRYTARSWQRDDMIVEDLVLTLAGGVRIRARHAMLETGGAGAEFREALRAENERQRDTSYRDPLRAASDLALSRPGPALDAAGDPVQPERVNPEDDGA